MRSLASGQYRRAHPLQVRAGPTPGQDGNTLACRRPPARFAPGDRADVTCSAHARGSAASRRRVRPHRAQSSCRRRGVPAFGCLHWARAASSSTRNLTKMSRRLSRARASAAPISACSATRCGASGQGNSNVNAPCSCLSRARLSCRLNGCVATPGIATRALVRQRSTPTMSASVRPSSITVKCTIGRDRVPFWSFQASC